MIFKQVDEILSGQKTQPRRVCNPGEGMYKDTLALSESGAVKWAVGKTYAVVPKRAQRTVLWTRLLSGFVWESPGDRLIGGKYWPADERAQYLTSAGYQPLRIRITAIRQERLQAITEADAKAEGVGSIEEYRALWERINGKTPGARWADDPLCWVLTFGVAQS